MILALEVQPPAGKDAVSWLLLTTLPITGFEDVVQYLRWYSYRWLVERYHYVLKSGCRLEQLQLERRSSNRGQSVAGWFERVDESTRMWSSVD